MLLEQVGICFFLLFVLRLNDVNLVLNLVTALLVLLPPFFLRLRLLLVSFGCEGCW